MTTLNRKNRFFSISLSLILAFLTYNVQAENLNKRSILSQLNVPSPPTSPHKAVDRKKDNHGLPEHYPKDFDVIGNANEINRGEGYIDVLAHHYNLSPAARYYSLGSKINSLSEIKSGMIVGLILDSKKRVKAIYEVPSSMFKPL